MQHGTFLWAYVCALAAVGAGYLCGVYARMTRRRCLLRRLDLMLFLLLCIGIVLLGVYFPPRGTAVFDSGTALGIVPPPKTHSRRDSVTYIDDVPSAKWSVLQDSLVMDGIPAHRMREIAAMSTARRGTYVMHMTGVPTGFGVSAVESGEDVDGAALPDLGDEQHEVLDGGGGGPPGGGGPAGTAGAADGSPWGQPLPGSGAWGPMIVANMAGRQQMGKLNVNRCRLHVRPSDL